jgi:hypothetical protein
MIVELNFREILRKAKFDEHMLLNHSLVECLRSPVQRVPALATLWAAYLEAIRKETFMFNVWIGKDGNPEVMAAHKDRDFAFRKARRLMKYCVISRGPELRDAAIALLEITPPLNLRWSRSVEVETQVIYKFIKKCRHRSHAHNIAIIEGLEKTLTELAELNVIVESRCKARDEIAAEVAALGRIIDVRNNTNRELVQFVKTVNALAYYYEAQPRARTVNKFLQTIGRRITERTNLLRSMVLEREEKRPARRKKAK